MTSISPADLADFIVRMEPWVRTLGKFLGVLAVISIPLLNMWREARRQRKAMEDQHAANESIKRAHTHVPLPASISHPMMQMYGHLQSMDALERAIRANTDAVNRQSELILALALEVKGRKDKSEDVHPSDL